jgi:hypothetical protein
MKFDERPATPEQMEYMRFLGIRLPAGMRTLPESAALQLIEEAEARRGVLVEPPHKAAQFGSRLRGGMIRILLVVLALASACVAVALFPVKTVTQATEPETNSQPALSETSALAAREDSAFPQQPVSPTAVKPVIIPASFSTSSAPEVSKVLPPPSPSPTHP